MFLVLLVSGQVELAFVSGVGNTHFNYNDDSNQLCLKLAAIICTKSDRFLMRDHFLICVQ